MTRTIVISNKSNHPNQVYYLRVRDDVVRVLAPGEETIPTVYDGDTLTIVPVTSEDIPDTGYHAVEECEFVPYSTLPGFNPADPLQARQEVGTVHVEEVGAHAV